MKSYEEAARDFTGNDAQLQAYNSTGNCVILAGPGSGKTKTLTIKMARILGEDVRRPRGVACITYSVECAAELSRRLGALHIEEAGNVFIGTVHSFCLTRVLLPFGHLVGVGYSEFAVAGEIARGKLFAQAVNEIFGPDTNPNRLSLRFDKYRRTFLDRESEEFKGTDEEIASLILRFEEILLNNNLIDFDGIVLHGLSMIERHDWLRSCLRAKFPVLIVDEYQDLGIPLHRIVMSLCFDSGIRLLAVGDPDQSIYGFNGASPELLSELSQREDVTAVKLQLNYRSGQAIIGMAETALGAQRGYRSAVSHKGVVDFHLCPDGIDQQVSRICEDIIPGIMDRLACALGDIAVLYIDKNDAAIIAETARQASFKFVRTDRGTPYRRSRLIRWLEACAQWSIDGWNGEKSMRSLLGTWASLRPDLCTPNEIRSHRAEFVRFVFAGRSPTMPMSEWLSELETSTSFAAALQENPVMADEAEQFDNLKNAVGVGATLEKLTIAQFCGHNRSNDHLNLVTIHSAKGLEFEAVILFGLEEGRLPKWSATDSETLREERRLFYVGFTRAKREVHLVYSGWYVARRQVYENGESRFVSELREKL